MSATMAVTPVLADTFTDDSQSIISGNAEIPAVDVESDTNCGDTMGDSDCIEKELTEFQDPHFYGRRLWGCGVCEIFQRK